MIILRKGNVERIATGPAEIARLKSDGYVPLEQPEVNEEKENIILDEMNLSELKALAKEKGLEGYSSLTKEQLLEVLKDVVK